MMHIYSRTRFWIAFAAFCSLLFFACSQINDPDAIEEITSETSIDLQGKLLDASAQSNYECFVKSFVLKDDPIDSEDEICDLGKIPDLINAWNNGNNKVGLKVLTMFDDNVAFSPLSLERAMGMLIEGARGTTYEELIQGMEMPKVTFLSRLGKSVIDAISQDLNNAIFIIDDHLWVQKEFELLQNYWDTIEALYGNAPTYLDFKDNPAEAAKQINASLKEATRGRFENLFNENSFNEDTRLVITNSTYFKSKWNETYKFDKRRTNKQAFYAQNERFMVDMMHSNALSKSDVFLDDEWIAVRIPFEDGFDYTAVLPVLKTGETTEMALKRVKKLFYKDYANDLLLNIDKRRLRIKTDYYRIELSMPKFELNGDIDLKKVLQKLGVTTVWNKDEAKKGHSIIDFSGMNGISSETATEDDGFLYPDSASQKVFLKIDEEGGEAAAVTGMLIERTAGYSQPMLLKIIFDHPYFYMISKGQTILFTGQVVDPRNENIALKPASDVKPDNSSANPDDYPDYFYTNLNKLNSNNPNVVDSLSKFDIAKLIRKKSDTLRACYIEELKTSPKLRGRVVLKWVITKQGVVQDAHIQESSVKNENFENCLLNNIKSWTFPESLYGGNAIVEYPFVFQPGDSKK